MRQFFVRLREDELRRLVEIANAERRRPQEQAAWLLSRALRELDKPAGGRTQNAPDGHLATSEASR